MTTVAARKLLKSLSIKQGIKYDSEESAAEIPAFIMFHKLNMDEVLDPLDSFKTFNQVRPDHPTISTSHNLSFADCCLPSPALQFFYRKLKPSARPIATPDDPTTLVSCADCRLMCFDTVAEAQKLWIKGREFTIAHLLGDKHAHEASKFAAGSVGIFRLAPQDYHRFQ